MKSVPLAIAVCFGMSAMASAAPGDGSVAEFLEKAEKLQKKGAMALLSSDVGLLKKEGKGAADAYRARIAADKAAGRPPHSCPPEGKKSMGSNELLAHLRSYPEKARATTSMKTAFADLMKKRYPCR